MIILYATTITKKRTISMIFNLNICSSKNNIIFNSDSAPACGKEFSRWELGLGWISGHFQYPAKYQILKLSGYRISSWVLLTDIRLFGQISGNLPALARYPVSSQKSIQPNPSEYKKKWVQTHTQNYIKDSPQTISLMHKSLLCKIDDFLFRKLFLSLITIINIQL